MKKLIKILIIGIFLLIVAAIVGAHFFLDGAITKGFNAVGPTITKTDTRIDGASLSILSGAGKMKGLFIGNPAGYESNGFAIKVASSSFAVKPASVLSDKIVIKSVVIDGPEVNLESDLKSINLKKLLDNVQESTGSSGKETPKEAAPKEQAKANKKIEVDEFVITGTKLHVGLTAPLVGRKEGTVTIPEIKLPPMGQTGDGVTVAEASSIALQALLKAAIQKGEEVAADMMKGGQYVGASAGTNTTQTIQQTAKGIGDLFKKKQ
jgi:hypothetical protein